MDHPGCTGIHHTAFATADIDKTIAYWRDFLGFKMILGLHLKQGRQYAFSVCGQMMIVFFEWDGVEPLQRKRHGEPVKGPFGFDHLAIGMKSLDDLYDLQDRMVAADLPVSDVMDHGYLLSIYTFDPNGIPLEFTSPNPKIDLMAAPVLKDHSPTPLASRGSEPVANAWPLPDEEDDTRLTITGEEAEFFSS